MAATPYPCPTVRRTRRADAERNRERILAAANAVFSESGLSAPMSDVARRAKVGIATLARNFPTREDLIAATFAATMTSQADAMELALKDPDPWNGFCVYVHTICELQAADRGFRNLMTMTFPTAPEFEADRLRAYRGFALLTKKAKATGHLRADFSPQDMPMMLIANASVISATGHAAPTASRRLVAYLLHAWATEGTRPLPPAPTPRQMHQALLAPTQARPGAAD